MVKRENQNKKSDPSDGLHKNEHILFFGSKKALYGGLLAGAIALGGQWLVGQVYNGYEARQLLEAVASSSLYLGSSIVTASATIIALMLTMLSLTSQSDSDFGAVFFKRIQQIARLSTIALSAGILLLLFLSVPLQESDKVPANWFKIIYYVLITFVAGLSGLAVGIVLMLLNSINSLIEVVRPSTDEEVEEAKNREDREEEESEQEKERIDEKDEK
ncbi:hypothetical protein BH18ACI1_BH18ACI1_23460 [soil metagenome]